MIQIAIVEDDKHQAESLQKYIARYEQESGQRFQISVFQDGEDPGKLFWEVRYYSYGY